MAFQRAIVSVSIQDADGDRASVPMYFVYEDTLVSLATLTSFAQEAATRMDDVSEGQVISLSIVLYPALPAGLKVSPVAGSDVEKTGLSTFNLTLIPGRSFGHDVPALQTSIFNGDLINQTNIDWLAYVAFMQSQGNVPANVKLRDDMWASELGSVKTAIKSFRKLGKRPQFSCFRVSGLFFGDSAMSQPLDHMGRYSLILRDGIPVPQFSVVDEPRYSICFNQSWLTPVVSALKILARPETWKADTAAEIRDAVRDGHTLLSAVNEFCGSPCANWYLDATNVECVEMSLDLNFAGVPGCDGCPEYRFYYGSCHQPTFAGSNLYSIEVRGLASANGSPVGGHFCRFTAKPLTNPLTPIYTYFYRDCLGALQTDTVPDETFILDDFIARSVCVQAPFPFCFAVVIDSPYVCGVA